MSDKQKKIFWFFAFAVTTILTLLPFFNVGITNMDDFQYFNTARADWEYWKYDATVYAQGQGRFYFLITKYFYYIPYLIDNFAYTKFIQYSSLAICYVLFSILIYKIFRSRELALITMLLLVFNTTVAYFVGYNPPTAYPFYFTFSLIIFISAMLLYNNYTEKGGYWRILTSAVLLFVSLLFYENYIVFIILFLPFIFVRNWKRHGFSGLWKNRLFYMEMIPYAGAILLYLACYFGYRCYITQVLGLAPQYMGANVAAKFSWENFFKVVGNFTFYNLPGRIFTFEETKYMLSENSLLIYGHKDSVWFILKHASTVAYINAIIQCVILWLIIRKQRFETVSWKTLALGIFMAITFAISSNVLVASTEKYNAEWVTKMQSYVTTFFSYFGIMTAIALAIVATLKIRKPYFMQVAVCLCWCATLFCFSVLNSYINEHLSRAWERSQNRITMIKSIAQEGFFKNIPIDAVIYTEQLLNTSYHGSQICRNSMNFEKYIMLCADNDEEYHFAQDKDELKRLMDFYPRASVFLIQATENKKTNDLLVVFSHIFRPTDSDNATLTADSADVFFLSPAKDYVLYYNTDACTDSMQTNAVTINSSSKTKRITHTVVKGNNIDPFGFSVSGLRTCTADTINLPQEKAYVHKTYRSSR